VNSKSVVCIDDRSMQLAYMKLYVTFLRYNPIRLKIASIWTCMYYRSQSYDRELQRQGCKKCVLKTKILFFYFEKRSSLRWRCSCKFRSRRIGSRLNTCPASTAIFLCCALMLSFCDFHLHSPKAESRLEETCFYIKKILESVVSLCIEMHIWNQFITILS
jgi:hypothetical protein